MRRYEDGRIYGDDKARIRQHSEIDENGCWIWQRHADPAGYGRIQWRGRSYLAHRAAYELFVGPIADGLTIDHLCNTPACVNPDHLEVVTMRENILRGDGLAGENARKTHCKYGHPFDEENTYEMPGGGRDCRACINRRSREYRQRKRASE